MSAFASNTEEHWIKIADKVRNERNSLRAAFRPELEKLAAAIIEKKNLILSLSATQLAVQISAGRISSEDAVILYRLFLIFYVFFSFPSLSLSISDSMYISLSLNLYHNSWRALQCGELLNSNATELFSTAIKEAKEEDTKRSAVRKELGNIYILICTSTHI